MLLAIGYTRVDCEALVLCDNHASVSPGRHDGAQVELLTQEDAIQVRLADQ
jgi:hypothetical protein